MRKFYNQLVLRSLLFRIKKFAKPNWWQARTLQFQNTTIFWNLRLVISIANRQQRFLREWMTTSVSIQITKPNLWRVWVLPTEITCHMVSENLVSLWTARELKRNVRILQRCIKKSDLGAPGGSAVERLSSSAQGVTPQGPGIESCIGLPAGTCFSLCLGLCVSWINKLNL